MYQGTYEFPRIERVAFGRDAAEVVRMEAERAGAQRVFILAPSALAREGSVLAHIEQSLGNRHAVTWTAVSAHTPRADVIAAAHAAREAKADFLVSVGGGSVTDAAKVINTCLSNDVLEVGQMDRLRKAPGASMVSQASGIQAPSLTLVAVPTTLAAAEYTAYAGVTNELTRLKEVFTHPRQVPKVIVLDPRASLHTPEMLWLSTGIRALDHAVEDICSIDAQPYSQGTALQAIRLLTHALPETRRDPANLRARLDAQMAAWLSTVGSQAGVNKGASHGIGHALGGTGGVPHGVTSCILMPHVMKFNQPVVEAQHALISEAMGSPDVDAWKLVQRLIQELGLPSTLSQVGLVTEEQIDAVAEAAMHDPWIRTNPRPITSAAQVRELLYQAR